MEAALAAGGRTVADPVDPAEGAIGGGAHQPYWFRLMLIALRRGQGGQ